MTDQAKFKLGDIVEVAYERKVLGYLYKEFDDRIVLSSTTEIEDSTPFKVVFKKDINSIYSFGKEEEAKSKESKQPEEMGRIVEFPANQSTEGDIS